MDTQLTLIQRLETSRTRQKPWYASGIHRPEDTQHEQQEIRDVRLPSTYSQNPHQPNRQGNCPDRDHRPDQMHSDKSHCQDKGWLNDNNSLRDDIAMRMFSPGNLLSIPPMNQNAKIMKSKPRAGLANAIMSKMMVRLEILFYPHCHRCSRSRQRSTD